MSKWNSIFKQLTLLTQLGLSFIMPTLLCLYVCYLLTAKCNVGGWIYILGFFFGFGGSFMTVYKFYTAIVRKDEKDKSAKKQKVSFNRHM